MATRPRPTASVVEFYRALLEYQEVGARAAAVARHVAQLLPGSAVVIYLVADQEDAKWVPKAWEGEVSVQATTLPIDTGTLGRIAEEHRPIIVSRADLKREVVAHLDIRRTLTSLAYIPISAGDRLIGTIEVLTFDESLGEETLGPILQVAEVAQVALSSALALESERHSNLESISRVTQLYDLVKVFSSTLEMSELFPIISSKFKDLLEVQAVNFWMVDADYLVLYNQAGFDPTASVGDVQKTGEGYLADIADSGEPVIIDTADDPRLSGRNANAPESPIFSAIACPIVDRNSLVGVVEVLNKTNGQPFHEDDLFFLTTITESAASALHNANLLQAERKVEILQALVQVSHEITSTLNMDRVLQAIVNGPSSVFRYERAAIAMEQSGRVHVRAISGMPQVNPGDVEVGRLRDILQWASAVGGELIVKQAGQEVDHPRPETRDKFQRYFAETGSRAFYALPLSDDQGHVGILAFESTDPDFLGEAQLEMIRVLAGQATVALRNAELYKEVPFIGVLEPLLNRKRRFLALGKRKRLTYVGAAVALAVALVAIPFPMRVDGDALVQPSRTARVQPEFTGIVKKVYVHEGETVKKDAILADLEDWDLRAALAQAQSKLATAQAEMNRALAANDGAVAGVKRVESDYWSAEVERARQRLEHAHLRSPIDGVVVTPFVDTFTGKSLEPGDTFAEVMDTSQASVDVAIDEHDVPLLKSAQYARVKLTSYPTATFKGNVAIVSPASQGDAQGRRFYARVDIDNAGRTVRPGMQGRGKVFVGWRPAGYVLFRGPAMWIWSHLWYWVG